MPIEVGIWKVNDGIKKVNYTPIESEQRLENILDADLSILSEDLLLIGRQVQTQYGKVIDLLAIDPEGTLHIVELKRNRTPREVVAQVLDYASWVQSLSYNDILSLYEEKQGKRLEEQFIDKFGISLPDKLNESHQLTIVSSELDLETERIIQYLSTTYNVPVNAVFFRYFKEGEQEFLTRSWLLDPHVVEEKTTQTKEARKKEKWNGQDFVVNFEDGSYRSWEDAVQYGFISAGNGKWYSRTLKQLFVGARVFCMIPKHGYVGIGEVIEEAKMVKDFTVDRDGQQINLTQVAHRSPELAHDIDDPEKCEYVVGIRWKKTVLKEKAYWIKGLSANQNTVFRLTSKYTMEKVLEFFDLVE